MKNLNKIILVSLLSVSLASCGYSSSDRAISGAGVGAGVGAVGGALVAGNPWGGAAVGAAAGSIIGAVSSPSKIDLGKPIWR